MDFKTNLLIIKLAASEDKEVAILMKAAKQVFASQMHLELGFRPADFIMTRVEREEYQYVDR